MLALIVLVGMLAGLAAAWRRFGIASCRLRKVVLVAVLGGLLGGLALYAALWLQPSAWLIAASDALLLFPLIVLTGSANLIVLSLLGPVLLVVEVTVVIFCVLVVLRQVLGRVGGRQAE